MVKRNKKGKDECLLNKLGIKGRKHTNNKGYCIIRSDSLKKQAEYLTRKYVKHI